MAVTLPQVFVRLHNSTNIVPWAQKLVDDLNLLPPQLATIAGGGGGGGVVISAGTTVATSGTVVLSNFNNVSFGLAGQIVTATASFAGGGGGVAIAASNTTYTSGTVNISGLNQITVRSTTGQGIRVDGPFLGLGDWMGF